MVLPHAFCYLVGDPGPRTLSKEISELNRHFPWDSRDPECQLEFEPECGSQDLYDSYCLKAFSLCGIGVKPRACVYWQATVPALLGHF